MTDRMFSGFDFPKYDLEMYLRHCADVPRGEIWVPKYVGPGNVRIIGRTKAKRNRKGPVSLALFAYPNGSCYEQRHLIRHYKEAVLVPVDIGESLMVDDPELDGLIGLFRKKGCFDDFGLRMDNPPVGYDFLQSRIGFIAGVPVYCPVHRTERKDITDPGWSVPE
ncbi:TPA: hypothetical protein HA265_05505 [Candidatus Woesearchaeota archaeon]|nr:hypothetical protein [Candidatus Woesearchaeota archaeon]